MGNDGGSIPHRRELVKSKPKAEQADKANQTRATWTSCALSKRPLQEPIVSCALGKLYNKDALLEYMLDKSAYGDGEKICGHIRSLKDVKQLNLTPNPVKSPSPTDAELTTAPVRAAYVCPLTMKEMNGVQPFVYLTPCGCVFSAAGLKTLVGSSRSSPGSGSTPPADGNAPQESGLELCPQCGTKFTPAKDVRTLNPAPEEAERMHEAMLAARAAEPAKKSKKRKAAAAVDADAAAAEGGVPEKKKRAGSGDGDEQNSKRSAPAPSTNPSVGATSRAVVASLALEEAKRKAGMSDAVRSLYGDKDAPKRKETYMTMGTFTRYA